MGYRLEISPVGSIACGGKLYGYISPETLHECKSWQWLRDHDQLEKEDQDLWDYGYDHKMILFKDEFKEFIELYIEDYNKHNPYHCQLELADFEKALKENCVRLEWM